MWWLVNARHLARYRHVPEWHLFGEVSWFCMRCVKGGKRERPAPLLRLVPAWER